MSLFPSPEDQANESVRRFMKLVFLAIGIAMAGCALLYWRLSR